MDIINQSVLMCVKDTSCNFHTLFTFSDFFCCVIEMSYAQRVTKLYGLKFKLK